MCQSITVSKRIAITHFERVKYMASELPKREDNQSPGGDKIKKVENKRYWKAARVVALFGIIESVSLVLWAKSEDFKPSTDYYIRWFAYCGLLSGGAFLAHKLTGGKFKKPIVCTIWTSWAIMCVLLLLTKSVEPHPQFTISLQIGDSTDDTLILTNDFLFKRRILKVGDLPNGKIMFKSTVNGCVVIPVRPNESNKVFNFIASDSPVKVSDLEALVGFPKDWECGVDPNKWHKMVGESLIIPKLWRFDPTNMQYFGAQSPLTLFAGDTLNFPAITNPCAPTYIGNTFKGGLVEFSLRSTDFDCGIAANIIFVSVSSNTFKPFVSDGHIDSNGLLHLSITPEEFENSQQ